MAEDNPLPSQRRLGSRHAGTAGLSWVAWGWSDSTERRILGIAKEQFNHSEAHFEDEVRNWSVKRHTTRSEEIGFAE